MSEPLEQPGPERLTATQWLIVSMAALGFAFDIYELLVMPLIARPALAELLQVDPNTDSGFREILVWQRYILWGSAVSGGIFGLLGGYLTDRFGRRRVLVWSILLYALSALAAGFSTTPEMLLIFRCTTFIGVCVEFVAAVAWLAELFPHPQQRERVLGYTQAFSSVGGLLVTWMYLAILAFKDHLPGLYMPGIEDPHAAWRYTLMSGLIPAIPLILVRPFLPESPAWQRKRAQGALQRPSFGVLFRPEFRRTTLVTAALFACGYGAAFGAIQLTPQIAPGLDPDLPKLAPLRGAYEAATDQTGMKLQKMKEGLEKDKKKLEEIKATGKSSLQGEKLAKALPKRQKQYERAHAAYRDPVAREMLEDEIKELYKQQEKLAGGVQLWQELGGLLGRFALAWLAVRILSRRRLLRVFQLPGLIIVPLVFFIPAAGNFPQVSLGFMTIDSLDMLKVGIFLVGFVTVAQFSFWGNYLPRVYPTYIRGTGESFAANVGGRMIGTAANPAATTLASSAFFLAALPALPAAPAALAYAAGIVGFSVYLIGAILTFWLPEPDQTAVQD